MMVISGLSCLSSNKIYHFIHPKKKYNLLKFTNFRVYTILPNYIYNICYGLEICLIVNKFSTNKNLKLNI